MFHLAYREDYKMVETACGLGCLVFGLAFGVLVWFGLVLGSLFLSPPSACSSLPSTMTWAPCPHGVRTRGKKTMLLRKGLDVRFPRLATVLGNFEQGSVQT